MKVERTCKECGKTFKIFPSRVKRGYGKFCSQECRYKFKIGKNSINWKGGFVRRSCQRCGKEFFVKPSRVKRGGGKFCSCKCADKWRSQEVKRICQQCGKEFYVKLSVVKRGQGKFCSLKCLGKWQSENRTGKNSSGWKGGKVKRNCEICGKEFLVKPCEIRREGGKFCSRKCYEKWYSKTFIGSKNHQWKGGVSESYRKHRAERGWKKRSRKTFERDNFQCQICGRNHKLNAHHIIPWRVSYNDKISNLITLCDSCHGKIEKVWWKYAPLFFEMNGVYVSKECSLFKQKGGENE